MICCALRNESGWCGTLESLLSLWWEEAGCFTMKKSNKPPRPKRLKGSYPLPNGNYVTVGKWSDPIDRAGKHRIRIVAVHKNPPDMDKLAKALLYLAEQLSKYERKSNSS
jgi:hypothetical protein